MFFSSGLRRDFGPGSDVDVLAYFESGQAVAFLRLAKYAKGAGRNLEAQGRPEDTGRGFRMQKMAFGRGVIGPKSDG
jgi:hypothetical protein